MEGSAVKRRHARIYARGQVQEAPLQGQFVELICRFVRHNPLYDTPCAAFSAVYHEPCFSKIVERFAQQVVSHQPAGRWSENTLNNLNGPNWAADMLQEEQTTARTENAICFANRLAIIGD